MPAVPELRQVRFEIRRGKVLGQPDSHQARDPNGNIGVAAEVKVDLKRIGIYNDPHPARRSHLRCQRVIQGDDCQGIGDHEFLEQAEEDALPGKERLSLCE